MGSCRCNLCRGGGTDAARGRNVGCVFDTSGRKVLLNKVAHEFSKEREQSLRALTTTAETSTVRESRARLERLAILLEDQDSIPSTHMVDHNYL